MSSAIYMTFDPPVCRQDWLAFCWENLVEYSPQTVGKNVFYFGGWGGVEIKFGLAERFEENEPGELSIPYIQYPDPIREWAKQVCPPKAAKDITVSTFFLGGALTDSSKKRCNNLLLMTSDIAKKIQNRFRPKKVEYDPELLPQRIEEMKNAGTT